MALDEPDTVTMRSGQEPSDMFIFAPDWKEKRGKIYIYLIILKVRYFYSIKKEYKSIPNSHIKF
jgi:hypothetical protein